METKKVTEEMRLSLNKALPSEAIKPHPTKTYLSSIKAIYVTERLNEVFGVGAWRTKVEKESVSENGMVVVKLTFEIPEYNIYYESYGGNDNGGETNKNFDLGDAFKGASTDALTKIGSFMEIGIDVFKGKTPTTQPKQATYPEKELEWLNLFDKAGNPTTKFGTLKAQIDAGKKFTLTEIRKLYKVSKTTEQQLLTNFNIK
jgi:hypothetical protein